MSKVDAMRALREARYAAAAKGGGGAAPAAPVRAKAPATTRPAVAKAAATEAAPAAAGALCGHRNMSGRSCTREIDHVRNGTKNHRYG